MYSLCDISHSNACEIMKKSGYAEWEVDWDFLVQQREVAQRGSMDGVDRVLAIKEKKKIDREEILLKRKQTESFRAESGKVKSTIQLMKVTKNLVMIPLTRIHHLNLKYRKREAPW